MAIITGKPAVPKFYRDFAKDRVLNYGGETNPLVFTRASVASYYNSSGILVTAAINEPRFDYDPTTTQSLGLLSEEQRINFALYNTQIGLAGQYITAGVAPLNLTMSATTSPDSTLSATYISQGTSSLTDYLYTQNMQILQTSSTYTYSIYIKQGTAPDFNVTIDDNSFGGQRYRFIYNFITKQITTITTGTLSGGSILSSSSVNLTNGWIRLVGTFVTGTGSITASPVDMITRYSSAGSVYVWGRQLEKGYFPTSFIYVTSSTPVTRSADFTYVSSSNTLMAPNPLHTWFAEFRGGKETGQNGYSRVIALGNNELIGTEGGAGNTIGAWNGNTYTAVTTNNNFQTTFGRAATSYNASTLEVTVTSTGLRSSNTLASLGTWDPNTYNVYLGGTTAISSNNLNGHIKRVMYYNTVLDPNYMILLTR